MSNESQAPTDEKDMAEETKELPQRYVNGFKVSEDSYQQFIGNLKDAVKENLTDTVLSLVEEREQTILRLRARLNTVDDFKYSLREFFGFQGTEDIEDMIRDVANDEAQQVAEGICDDLYISRG